MNQDLATVQAMKVVPQIILIVALVIFHICHLTLSLHHCIITFDN